MSVVVILLFSTFVCILLLKGYFFVANKIGIFDIPNRRSSHNHAPVRGAGVIFPIAMIVGFFLSESPPFLFMAALVVLSLVSFWDDVSDVSAVLRFSFHILAALLIIYQIWLDIPSPGFAIFIFCTTILFINGFNFMDGINGITGFYSIVFIVSLFAVNCFVARIIDPVILVFTLAGVLAFGVFNFRKQAVCFSGDIGSVIMALFIVYMLMLVVLSTGEYYYFIFVSVYFIDFGITILHRIFLKEKIWEPHRKHLYQLLANEKGYSHLLVAGIYSFVQLFVNIAMLFVIYYSKSWLTPYLFAGLLIITMIAVYLILRRRYFSLHQP